MLGIERQRFLEVGEALLISVQTFEHAAAGSQRLDVIGPDGERPVEAGDRLAVAFERSERPS